MSVCRIHPPGPHPAPALLARCTRLPTSILSDAMERTGCASGVHWVRGARWERAAGPAFTVRTRAGDRLVVHRAVDLAPPGSVLVIDAGGHLDRAVFGEILARYAAVQGVRAVVLDGAVRDVEGLAAGPVVCAGDIVVGDADGVAVVPACRLAEVLDTAEGLLRDEEGVFAAGTWDRGWVRAALDEIEVPA